LADALKSLTPSAHPDLLVGFNTADDAGVFRISDKQALVQTVDFFPPIVDDPYAFGQIAAANALSDVYAMGGRPVTALNIVGFPKSVMPPDILTQILRGGQDKIAEAEAVIVGGHSINDKELKYGLAVTGVVDPNRIFTNAGARAGDVVFLTKKLGTGLITTGIKRGMDDSEAINAAVQEMTALNRRAAELMIDSKAGAATDVTGYGLLGHALEMAQASAVTIRVFSHTLPLLPKALEMAEQDMVPGGAHANRDFLEGNYRIESDIDPNLIKVLFDPQTSGGLLIAVPELTAGKMQQALQDNGLPFEPVARVEPAANLPLLVE
jgi:selenide,water dikinase